MAHDKLWLRNLPDPINTIASARVSTLAKYFNNKTDEWGIFNTDIYDDALRTGSQGGLSEECKTFYRGQMRDQTLHDKYTVRSELKIFCGNYPRALYKSFVDYDYIQDSQFPALIASGACPSWGFKADYVWLQSRIYR